MKVIGIVGSLRKGSYNRALLEAARTLAPNGMEIEVVGLEGIPVYNQDLEAAAPDSVVRLKAAIRAADAVVIATPEYNYSVPGVLKNAIDWVSRPPSDNPFDGKPIAIMSASNGTIGGVRAQLHLRQVFVFLNGHVLPKPEVVVTFEQDKIKDGVLVDEKTRELVRRQLDALASFARRLKA